MIPDIKKENDLRKLAGLPIKEAEHSLDSILNKYPEEFKSVMMGQSMLYDHDNFFDELYDWFVNSGEMPYGIAKAREGDPDQFIQDYLEQENGHEFDDEQAMDAQKTQMPASLGGTFGEGINEHHEKDADGNPIPHKEPETFKEHLDAVQKKRLDELTPSIYTRAGGKMVDREVEKDPDDPTATSDWTKKHRGEKLKDYGRKKQRQAYERYWRKGFKAGVRADTMLKLGFVADT